MGERNVKHHGRNDAGNGSHRACTDIDLSPQGYVNREANN